jgi:ankyrin repeat protein
MNRFFSCFIALFLFLMSYNVNCMEQLFSYSDDPTRNALVQTCTTFYAMGRKNNCFIYTHTPLVLNRKQKVYALLRSIHCGNKQAVENLLNNGAESDRIWCLGILPITLARHYSNQPIISLLEKYELFLEVKMCPLFVLATYVGDLPLLEQCINTKEYDPTYIDNEGGALLSIASRNGHEGIVKRLLDDVYIQKIINYKGRSETALYAAAAYGHIGILKQLLAVPGIDVHIGYNDWPPICAAAYRRHHHIVELLITHPDIDVNARNGFNNCSLHEAVYSGDVEMVKILFTTRNIDPNIVNKDNKTPLDVAKKLETVKEMREIKQLLLDKGGKTVFYMERINPLNDADRPQ